MSPTAGDVVYAVVPFAPEPPFRVFAGPSQAPVEVPKPDNFFAAARKGEAEFSFIVPAKARPVLIVSAAYDSRLNEVLALRMVRFGKLSGDEQAAVRSQDDPALFHLPPDRFDLPEENAVLIASLVRIPVTAIGNKALGRLNQNELRVIHERLARRYRLDLSGLVRDRIEELAAKQRGA